MHFTSMTWFDSSGKRILDVGDSGNKSAQKNLTTQEYTLMGYEKVIGAVAHIDTNNSCRWLYDF